uniref:Prostate-associated microseminoprotein n=1 Tax=Seriola lalandi dorsalis TaxID=1841481 RepID=A0A3B4WSU2_SERLL
NTLRLLWRYQRKGTIFPMILQIRLQIANKWKKMTLCVFEGRHYSLGETWMDNACMQCTCLHPVGVGCCETVHRPVDFPAWCEVRVEPVSCKVSLVQAADPRLPCSPAPRPETRGLGPWKPPPRSSVMLENDKASLPS